ncbi:EF-hand domain-containing protein [Actinocorallia sp. A-T 12471]|uniref:EF-hand domain-containing protein n=1 Tax=Actinocorallia sp. A-T 12471 TaxID=3089813 RepID=UPI0029D1C2C9|nr:EF-hand domain-containing protein [Actinocorallia sp. A-T 12471]MDX6741295.1 EF-hand domain-containing protein [Actinocorallia sp. A-T 12471]
MTEGQARELFPVVDTNGDGQISRQELARLYERNGTPITEEESDAIFGKADSDGDGLISLEEFVDFLL